MFRDEDEETSVDKIKSLSLSPIAFHISVEYKNADDGFESALNDKFGKQVLALWEEFQPQALIFTVAVHSVLR